MIEKLPTRVVREVDYKALLERLQSGPTYIEGKTNFTNIYGAAKANGMTIKSKRVTLIENGVETEALQLKLVEADK